MPDPTLTLIDAFSYSDGALPAPWVSPMITGGTVGALTVASGVVKNSVATACDGYRDVTDYASGVGAFATLAFTDGSSDGAADVNFMLQGSGLSTGDPDGYGVQCRIRAAATDTLRIRKYTAGVEAIIASLTQDVAPGGIFGGIKDNTTHVITFWYKPPAGSWSALFTFTDSSSPWTGGGKIGVGVNENSFTVSLDDLSTGVVAAAADTPAWPMRALLRW